MKKIFKNLLFGTAALFALLVIVGGFLLFKALPSPEKIAQSFRGRSQKLSQDSAQNLNTSIKSSGEDVAPSGAPEAAASTEDLQKSEALRAKDEKGEKILKDFLAEDLKDIRVCNNLGVSKLLDENAHKTEEEKSKLDFESWFSDDSRGDSLAESMRFPMKVILQDSSVRPLFDEIFAMEKDLPKDAAEKESFLKKIGFYSRVTTAVAGLYSKKSFFEHMANRSIHLGVLAKIAHAKPEMRTDPRLNQLCQEMTRSMTEGARVDIGQERQEILTLIDEAGLTLEQVDFDPASFIKFRIKSDSNNLQFSLTDKDEQSQ